MIKNSKIRDFAEKAVSMLPDYFFVVAASSTGKFHPKYALGEGGLVRHTKAAVKIAHDMLGLEMYSKYTQDTKDLIITALILHDGLKHGERQSKYTIAEHPTVMAAWIKNNDVLIAMLEPNQIEFLTGCIASHMGEWNTDYRSKKEIMPKPKTAEQRFVHICDYLASRKYLEVDFGENYYNPEDYKDNTADELQETIDSILTLCKKKIESGIDKDKIYGIIANQNKGKKNPNSIKDIDVAKAVLGELEVVA